MIKAPITALLVAAFLPSIQAQNITYDLRRNGLISSGDPIIGGTSGSYTVSGLTITVFDPLVGLSSSVFSVSTDGIGISNDRINPNQSFSISFDQDVQLISALTRINQSPLYIDDVDDNTLVTIVSANSQTAFPADTFLAANVPISLGVLSGESNFAVFSSITVAVIPEPAHATGMIALLLTVGAMALHRRRKQAA
ncbi:hypothetical protein GCM10007047_10380 [Cerasicoccus arenae]|uniref:PEP-CTERM sorting domain-containing protein n=2 Tax=Cerasicoccus arenae TaxID=424488 RepID=A0A8J3DGJ4_9BACT|nr:hypothetical protein GCM10007047_10380 [Cerasicoccus arenae]